MRRICRTCGREYDGAPGSTLCPSCVSDGKKTTIRDRICRTCGATFPGGPRAWYCPSCREERKRGQQRIQKRKGPARLLGSIDKCVICGGEYIVTGGLQKYCPACAPEAIKAADRAQGRAWHSANHAPEARREMRKAHAAEIICVICGKAFVPKDASITCSKSCSAALTKHNAQRFERDHRDQRNEQQRKNLRARLDAMTPEERETHRIETNRRARENYHKRKEKKHD